ncbi:MAG TPA: hypothetical protein VMT53_15705 [Terriglobales bacterium]|jgi:hypothetical protein|nr:hypothetical protein [Terriglobales bacterium]
MKSAAKTQPTPDKKDDADWRHFPVFEEVLSSEHPAPLLAKVEKTCRQLNDVIQSGSEADKVRAQLAMTAYGRSLDLLRVLTEVRDRAVEQKQQLPATEKR